MKETKLLCPIWDAIWIERSVEDQDADSLTVALPGAVICNRSSLFDYLAQIGDA